MAAIGASFRAPLGGAVLGAELRYRDDVESEALVPSFIATIIAYSILGFVEGFVLMQTCANTQTHDTLRLPAHGAMETLRRDPAG
jgi:H+/Cl- antiporter ClcA